MMSKAVVKTGRVALACGVLSMTGVALAGGPAVEVIYTKIPTHPSSIVPGARDATGNPVETRFRAIEDLLVSPDGSRWIIKGRTQLGTGLENIMLIGSGKDGGFFAQSGQPLPGGTASEKYDFFGSGLGRFNELNHFAYSARAMGGVASVFQKVLVHTGGLTFDPADFALVAQMGDLYTGLVDLPPNPSGDETIGNSIGSIHIQNNGVLGAQDTSIGSIHSSRRPAIFYADPVKSGHVTFNGFKQVGVSTFLGMDGNTVHTYASTTGGLGSNSFYTTHDGARWLVTGVIAGAPTISDAVLVVDGQARLQEGVAIPGDSAVVSTVVTADWIGNEWIARGAIQGGGVYAVRNGTLLAKTGQPISGSPVGAAENWASTFLAFTGNRNGDWVLVGKTDNPNPAIDDVVVVNGEVVLREGDQITLEGYEGSICIGRGNNTLVAFEANDVVLTDDGLLYIFVTINDCQGNDLNSNPAFVSPQAFVRLDLGGPLPCVADVDPPGGGDGVVNVNDLLAVINNWGPCPFKGPCPGNITPDGVVNVNDLLAVINSWGQCPQ